MNKEKIIVGENVFATTSANCIKMVVEKVVLPKTKVIVVSEGEYAKVAKELGGSTIRITNSTNNHIVPFDLNIEKSKKG